jgi:hypothetical protein
MDVVFGRRRSFRVQPNEPMPVELDSAAGGVTGEIVDLSVSGASVVVASTDETERADRNPMLRFRLPGDEPPIEIAGHVQFRKLEGATVRLGVEFDRRGTLDYAADENRIAG